MRKTSAILFGFILAALISMSTISPALAQVARTVRIDDYRWFGASHEGYDDFYRTTVTAYEAGSNATLIVYVYAECYITATWEEVPANVTAVIASFDWDINYTWTGLVQIESKKTHVFNITFTVPTTTVASNMLTHKYKIYVEHVNSTTAPQKTYTTSLTGSPRFAVYSADQADAQELKGELETWEAAYGAAPSVLYMPSEARELWIQAGLEKDMAEGAYRDGNFADAKTHYGNAVKSLQDAITSEVNTGASFEDALLDLVNSAGSYLSMQGWGFIVISIGFLFMGIGVLVYLVRKSGPPAAA